MGKAAPIKQTLGKTFHIGQNGSTGGGEAGNGFKNRIHIPGDLPGQSKGQSAQKTHDDPGKAYAHQTFSGTEQSTGLAAGKIQNTCQGENDAQSDAKGRCSSGAVHGQTDTQGGNHKDTLYGDDLIEKSPNHFIIHSRDLRRKYR